MLRHLVGDLQAQQMYDSIGKGILGRCLAECTLWMFRILEDVASAYHRFAPGPGSNWASLDVTSLHSKKAMVEPSVPKKSALRVYAHFVFCHVANV